MVQFSLFTAADVPAGFRAAAAEESVQLVERNGGLPPEQTSLCLPAGDSRLSSLKGHGYAVIARLIMGVAGIVAGGVIAIQMERPGNDRPAAKDADRGTLAIAGCCSVGGILVLLSNPFFQSRFVRTQLGQRYNDLMGTNTGTKPVSVGVENAATFSRFKMVPEDMGFLVLDPDRLRIVIEGVGFRYFVYAKDVINISEVAGSTNSATAIEYRVGATELSIAVQTDSIWHEFKKQTIGVKEDALISRIRDALGK